jgi:uncharacterized protein YjbI with pentapeptide repeats
VALIFFVIGLFVYFVARKTLWELLELLIVPFALAGIGLWFTAQQDARQQQIEGQRSQDAALQAYLDQMSTLLIAKDLRSSTEDNATEDSKEAQILARARTLAVLGSLGPDLRQGPDRKGTIIKFLYEAALIDRDSTVIKLEGADLSRVNLVFTDLREAYLPLVILRSAKLSNADLGRADLGGADLRDTILEETRLSDANLHAADLRGAVLSDADLHDANLSHARLSGATGITGEDLERQASSLQGAVMPKGGLHVGPYVTIDGGFEPALLFTISKGWRRPHPEAIDLLYLDRGPHGGVLAFASPRHVFDPNNPSEREEVTAPGNAREWVSWFQRHRSLDTSKPVPVTVGGAPGKRIDVTATSTPENYPPDLCGEDRCVPLFPASGVPSGIVSYPAWTDRFIIVDVAGEPVVINIGAPAGKFDDFLPKAQKVLNTVRRNSE